MPSGRRRRSGQVLWRTPAPEPPAWRPTPHHCAGPSPRLPGLLPPPLLRPTACASNCSLHRARPAHVRLKSPQGTSSRRAFTASHNGLVHASDAFIAHAHGPARPISERPVQCDGRPAVQPWRPDRGAVQAALVSAPGRTGWRRVHTAVMMTSRRSGSCRAHDARRRRRTPLGRAADWIPADGGTRLANGKSPRMKLCPALNLARDSRTAKLATLDSKPSAWMGMTLRTRDSRSGLCPLTSVHQCITSTSIGSADSRFQTQRHLAITLRSDAPRFPTHRRVLTVNLTVQPSRRESRRGRALTALALSPPSRRDG